MKRPSSFQRIRSEWRFLRLMIATNLAGAMEFRGAFLLQVFGMLLNDVAFLFLWIYFFRIFGTINGWSQYEVIGLQGILALVFGIGMSFGNGIFHLPDYVDKGAFDQFLLSPRHLYLHILTSKIGIASLGDIFFGFMLLVFYFILSSATPLQVFLLFTLLLPVLLIFINYCVVINLIGFLIPDAAGTAKNLFNLMLSPGMFPYSLYQGVLRLAFIFIIPAITVAGLPLEVVRTMSWRGYALVWLIGIVWTVLAVTLLRRAVRRYESGNLTGARV